MKQTYALLSVLAIAAIAPVVGCAADYAGELDANNGLSSGAGPGGGLGSGGEGGGMTPLPPEEELESNYSAPVATGNYVWIANPVSGRVAYIDAT